MLKNSKRMIEKYLKQHFFKYVKDIEDGTERISIVFNGYDCCPDSIIESCIYFNSDSMECRTYYSQSCAKWCAESSYRQDLYRLLNFINARVFPTTPDDGIGGMLYKPSYLYSPRMHITEDGCFDVTLTTIIPYDFFDVAPLETLDYLTVSCPELLNKLSLPIFSILLGKWYIISAISYIKTVVLMEDLLCDKNFS